MNSSYNPFTPTLLPLNGTQFIIPYWADVDLRGTGNVFYRQNRNTVLLARATNEIQTALSLSQNITVTSLFIVTWDAVGYHNVHTDKVGLYTVHNLLATVLDCMYMCMYIQEVHDIWNYCLLHGRDQRKHCTLFSILQQVCCMENM